MTALRTLSAAAALIGAIPTTIMAQSNPRPIPGMPGTGGDNTHLADRGSYTTCEPVPSLHCRNGSTCTEGIADFGKQHDHLGLQTHEDGYYCKCLPGYIGHECQIQVDDCDGDTGYNPSDPTGVLSSCYHGASCKSNGGGFYCDCHAVNENSGPTAKKFAGLMCQHESTSLCAASLVGMTHAPNQQFCTNHGKCVKMVIDSEPHPGCVCRDGWAGDHCEIEVDPNANIPRLAAGKEGGGNPLAGKILFSMLIVVMGMVVVGIGVILRKAKMERDGAVGGGTPAKKTVVGAGDLEPDGSGTLGNKSEGTDADETGDLELTVQDTDDKETANDAEEEEEVAKPEIV